MQENYKQDFGTHGAAYRLGNSEHGSNHGLVPWSGVSRLLSGHPEQIELVSMPSKDL